MDATAGTLLCLKGLQPAAPQRHAVKPKWVPKGHPNGRLCDGGWLVDEVLAHGKLKSFEEVRRTQGLEGSNGRLLRHVRNHRADRRRKRSNSRQHLAHIPGSTTLPELLASRGSTPKLQDQTRQCILFAHDVGLAITSQDTPRQLMDCVTCSTYREGAMKTGHNYEL